MMMIIFFPMLTISCVCLYTLPERFSDLVCTLHSPPLSAVCCPPITGLSRPVLAAVPSPDSHIFHLHNTSGIYITTQTGNQVSSASGMEPILVLKITQFCSEIWTLNLCHWALSLVRQSKLHAKLI